MTDILAMTLVFLSTSVFAAHAMKLTGCDEAPASGIMIPK
jgi:hypothetical protein